MAPAKQNLKSTKGDMEKTFAVRTHEMVTYAAIHRPKVIYWIRDGEAFVVNQVHHELKAILTMFFRHNKYQSFQRQLNMYGFSKQTSGKYEGAFHHPSFHRDDTSKLKEITRRPPPPKNSPNSRKMLKEKSTNSEKKPTFGAKRKHFVTPSKKQTKKKKSGPSCLKKAQDQGTGIITPTDDRKLKSQSSALKNFCVHPEGNDHIGKKFPSGKRVSWSCNLFCKEDIKKYDDESQTSSPIKPDSEEKSQIAANQSKYAMFGFYSIHNSRNYENLLSSTCKQILFGSESSLVNDIGIHEQYDQKARVGLDTQGAFQIGNSSSRQFAIEISPITKSTTHYPFDEIDVFESYEEITNTCMEAYDTVLNYKHPGQEKLECGANVYEI